MDTYFSCHEYHITLRIVCATFSSKMDLKLKSAESAIAFIQKEHERVLHGLHMEIERLQQKCSGKGASIKDVCTFHTGGEEL